MREPVLRDRQKKSLVTEGQDFDWQWYRFVMDFEERVKQSVREGLKSVAADREAHQAFKERWAKIRESEVTPVFDEAEVALVGDSDFRDVYLDTRQENGCTILILAFNQGQGQPELRFCPNAQQRIIECRTDPEDLMTAEDFNLDNLTGEMVRDKVTAFINSAFDHHVERSKRARSS